ncbi:MAG: glycosyltransferase, partial [Bacteroidetes bacterium]|nr:glycosyltransferase [Bacteroidota bacterium]
MKTDEKITEIHSNHSIQSKNHTFTQNGITTLIPFRNEAHRIHSLLNSLKKIEVPVNWEIIFCDDHSHDLSIDIIQKSSDSPFKDVIQKLTVEERACLTIMLFLYRSGRTNEQRTGVDNTYETRSANIFEIVATKLKFNPALVQAMKNSIYFI